MKNTPVNVIPFLPSDILIPKNNKEQFAVIACDQYTSEPEYWKKAAEAADGKPSALDLILPEVYLSSDEKETAKRVNEINENMRRYLAEDVFTELHDTMIFVERTLPDGSVRRGIVGAVDLEQYDYAPESRTLIRATEGTVPERLPPRMAIRRGAPIELPHVMMLIDDPDRSVIEPFIGGGYGETVYDFDLMLGAGHIKGRALDKEGCEKVEAALKAMLDKDGDDPLLFAVGDGNHSLATALGCYREKKAAGEDVSLCRYALCEVVNVHDEALEFEPIYRVLSGIDPKDFAAAAKNELASALASVSEKGEKRTVEIVTGTGAEELAAYSFPVGIIQSFCEKYIAAHGGSLDYVHGLSSAKRLGSADGCAAILFDGMKKSELFPYVRKNGPLPRKAFSMGGADTKRFYVEARRVL